MFDDEKNSYTTFQKLSKSRWSRIEKLGRRSRRHRKEVQRRVNKFGKEDNSESRNLHVFNGTNFQSWLTRIKALLKAKDLEQMLKEFVESSSNVADAKFRYVRQESKTLNYIMDRLNEWWFSKTAKSFFVIILEKEERRNLVRLCMHVVH